MKENHMTTEETEESPLDHIRKLEDALKLALHQRDTLAYSNKGNAERLQSLADHFARQEQSHMDMMQRLKDRAEDAERELGGLSHNANMLVGGLAKALYECIQLCEVYQNNDGVECEQSECYDLSKDVIHAANGGLKSLPANSSAKRVSATGAEGESV